MNCFVTGRYGTKDTLLCRILMEYGIALLPGAKEQTIRTPCGPCTGVLLAPHKEITVVSILRSGDALLDAARSVAPSASVGKVLIQRNESSEAKEPHVCGACEKRDSEG
jgi:uracil phosphoribosyltransferase